MNYRTLTFDLQIVYTIVKFVLLTIMSYYHSVCMYHISVLKVTYYSLLSWKRIAAKPQFCSDHQKF